MGREEGVCVALGEAVINKMTPDKSIIKKEGGREGGEKGGMEEWREGGRKEGRTERKKEGKEHWRAGASSEVL